ncbi:ATPase domain-containing protein [Promethearchaeum syntrophicum]|uniref:DNA repair and recombination protein RadA n=1 Tax=Promethearchaeum syntrophicum TaxID=2594042 RepID=A0A5B9D8G4_9ARCH|nr:ATPase domain-containing protein [Candidatus Prometheoarchaeum syntrophicum]QEE15372.1 DNA repair and recombination protein RadA [Candidatus Prometheoarchaeum syntrophicum]
MNSLKNLEEIDQVLFNKLKEKGWINPSFLGLLNRNEIKKVLDLKPDLTVNSADLEEIMNNYKKKNQLVSKEYFNLTKSSWHLTTGSINLDRLLLTKGVPSRKMTLLYGKFRSGKSQIAHQCCVNSYDQFQEKLPKYVSLFIDTEGTFRPERIQQMANAKGLPVDDVLRRIYIIQIQSNSELKLAFSKVEEILLDYKIKFIAIDSLTNFVRLEIAKKEKEVNLIITEFSQILRKLSNLAIKFNIPILCTSQVSSTLNNFNFFDIVPILSTTLNTYIKEWILLGENPQFTSMPENSGRRFAHLVNSESNSEEISQFLITTEGIIDIY